MNRGREIFNGVEEELSSGYAQRFAEWLGLSVRLPTNARGCDAPPGRVARLLQAVFFIIRIQDGYIVGHKIDICECPIAATRSDK